MILHQLITVINLVYICYDPYMFASRVMKYTEITSEFLLLVVSILLQQYMIYYDKKEISEQIEKSVFVALGSLLATNIAFMIYTIVTNRKEQKRAKALKKAQDLEGEKKKETEENK